MKAFWVVWSCLFLSFFSSAGTISLTADTSPPDPNEEITVWVHTDEPLLFMELDAYVTGDATITSAMSEADCNEFGWENGWGFESIIDDPNGWVSIGGICWAADANDTVGYFKFRYHSGQVTVYIDQENSMAGNWNGNSTFSSEVLLFGQMILPEPIEPNEPTPVLVQCPLGSGGPSRGESDDFSGWSEEFGRGMEDLDSEPNIIEIDSDITTNQIWTSDNVYYITAETVNVQALLVVEPNTLVIFGYDCAMFVNNGGTLISRGTPDQPIIYTCDGLYFYYPERLGYYWFYYPGTYYYYCPIYIESTASPATTIAYSFVEGAIQGIVTNNIRLDNPIENNYLFGNRYGVLEYGPKLTDIRNNLCFYNDEAGIEVYLGDVNGATDANNIFTIEQNTCDAYQYCGITVHGAADANEVPTVHLLNNIVSESYWYGLNLGGGPMWLLVANTGYFDNNLANKNDEGIDEYNPVEVDEFSYTWGERFYQTHYLAQDCNFINAGAYYIEQTPQIGMTTDVNSLPDCNFVDLGFHYPNWNYTNTGSGFADTDFDQNGITDINDLLVITDQWLDTVTPSSDGDLNSDGDINLTDFFLFAANWLKTQGNPVITPSIGISDEDGSIGVQVQNNGEPIYQYFLLIDGLYAKELMFSDGLFQHNIYMPWLSPGSHEARIIGSGQQGITCSAVIPFEIDNAIGPCIVPIMFEMGEPLLFSANSGIDVTVSAWVSGQEVWSQSYPSGMVQGAVPATVTDANDVEFLLIAPTEQSAGASPVAVPVVSADDGSGDYTALMIRPYMALNFGSGLADYVYEKLVELGYKVKKLRCYNSSFKNVIKYIDKNTIKVLYYDGHGNYKYPETEIYRSVVGLDDGNIVSDKVSNYPPGQAPSWLEPLPPAIEASVKTWRELNLKDLKFAAFDACEAMRLKINGQGKLEESTSQAYTYRGDLTMALLQRGEFVDQWVFGWAGDFVSGYGTPWQGFSITIWEELGEKKDIADAISEAYGEAPSEVRNAYRLQGHDDPFDFKL